MKITITVPKPCHEDWQAMSQDPNSQAGKQGRHCAQCDHVVADLTTATDAQLVALFTSDAKPHCARFDPAQLDRALGASERHSTSALPLAAFTSLLAVAAGQQAIAQGGPVVRPAVMLGEPAISRPAPPPPLVTGKMMAVPHVAPPLCNGAITGDTVVVERPDEILELVSLGQPSIRASASTLPAQPSESTEICGTLVDDRTNEPLRFASVTLRFHGAHTETDAAGNFRLQVPTRISMDLMVLDVTCSGYDAFSKEVFSPGGHQMDTSIPVSGPIPGEGTWINGFVSDVPSGLLLAGTVVRINGRDERIRCDERGYFGLRVPEELVGTEVMLEFSHATAGSMSLPVLTDRLPLFLPVKFTGTPRAQVPENPEHCREVGVLRMKKQYERFISTLGGAIVTISVQKPTLWQRVTGPFRGGW